MNAKMIAALAHAMPTIDPSLRLYIPFNEGVGSVAKDYSQYGNNCALTDVKWGVGGGGNAGIFNDNSSFGNCGNDPSLNITDAITIDVWVKRANVTGTDIGLVARELSSVGYVVSLSYTIDDDKIEFIFPGVIAVGKSVSTISDLNWHHIVVTVSKTGASSSVKFYIDGEFDVERTPAATIQGCTHDFIIGYRSNYFNGTIDEVRIYDKALSAEEILAHYNAAKARYT